MKILRHLIHSVEQWRPLQRLDKVRRNKSAFRAQKPKQLPVLSADDRLSRLGLANSKVYPCRALRRPRRMKHPRLFLALAVATLTATMGQRFYDQPELQADTEAPQTIIAPVDASVVDEQTTEEKRRAARNGVLKVLTLDEGTNESIERNLDNLIQQATGLRRQAGPFPFVGTDTLSTPVQRYLRSSSHEEWDTLATLIRTPSPGSDQSSQARLQRLTPIQRRVLREFTAYRQRRSDSQLLSLQVQVVNARRLYQQAKINLALAADKPLAIPNDVRLLELTDTEWKQAQAALAQAIERMILQGIMPGLPPELELRAVRAQLQGSVPARAENFAVQVLSSVLQPNLIEDSERTRIQAEMAAEAVASVTVSVSAGEIIVKAGETITQSDFVLLDHFNLSQRRFNRVGLSGFALLVSGCVAVFVIAERVWHPGLRQRDYVLLIMMVLSTAGLSIVGTAAYSLPAIGLLSGSFYGPVLGGALVALLALVLPVGTSISAVPLLSSAAGALVCSIFAARLRSREELAMLGGGVGLTQGLAYLLLILIFSPVSPSAWTGILTGAAMQGVYGVISSIVALGLSPYLERLFDLVTPIRLAELANPNRPMLKRLASEAPGTFQHTLFVASLAEAAARSLGCNVELVRTGTLYHDIGKMHDPLGFIENQMGGPNKHDAINDPWESANIIRKHVTEGLVMARKCGLPKAVQSFIPEHQGTMLISYFYHQAQQLAAPDPDHRLDEMDFRYDGPIPQSPETGIVMLADSCEAALRSLKDATPEEALNMVNRIMRARWKENQLIDSGLTREHLSVIATIFVQVWQQYNHQRIAYPKTALVTKPSV